MESICALKEVYKVLYQYEKKFVDDYAITINEAMLLCQLKDGQVRSASEICEYIGLSMPRVSKIITLVEKKNFIKRAVSKEDHRKMMFKLTSAGREKIEAMKQVQFDMHPLCECLENFIEQQ